MQYSGLRSGARNTTYLDVAVYYGGVPQHHQRVEQLPQEQLHQAEAQAPAAKTTTHSSDRLGFIAATLQRCARCCMLR